MATITTSQVYAYNGSLAALLGLDVAPSFTRLDAQITDTNGVLTATDDTTISLNNGPVQDLDFVAAGTVSGLLGLTGTQPIAVFTIPDNPDVTYLYAPNGLPTLLGATVVYTYNLNQTSFALPTTTPGIVDGTDGNDTMLVGYEDADGDRITNSIILGPNGNDVIDGKAGNDYIEGGSGNDTIYGGTGNDTLLGQAGNDSLVGGDGDDLIRGGAGADNMQGGAGSDTVDYSDNTSAVNINLLTNTTSGGNAAGDTISGFENVIGGTGNDTLTLSNTSGRAEGGAGNDTIIGGTGNDTIIGGDGGDSLVGGAGNDLFLNSGEDSVGLSLVNGRLNKTDTIRGGEGNDTWRAAVGTDGLAINDGTDEVLLEGGNDFAEAGMFNVFNNVAYRDTLDGGTGQDTISLGVLNPANNQGITFNEDGTATTIGFTSVVRNFESAWGNAGNNTFTGNSLANEFLGLGGDDVLIGNGGDDTLDGGDGNDLINGGTGNDRLIGGNGADRFIYAVGDGRDTIVDFNQNDEVLGDDDTTNNDFIDLSRYYDSLVELRADLADNGVLDQSNSITNGGTVDYGNNLQFGANAGLVFTGINADNVKDLLTEETTGVTCFARGTMIDTPSGQVAIEMLRKGDLVRTMDRGFQPLRWIGSRALDAIDLRQSPKLRPIRIRAGALGENLPVVDLTVSPQHRVLVRSVIAERMFGAREILVAANKLLAIDGIEIDEAATEVTYFHMLFDRHEIVFSNGSATESLFTGPEAIRSLTREARAEIYALFPELQNPDFITEPARIIPDRGAAMRKLALRHEANRKPIFQ